MKFRVSQWLDTSRDDVEEYPILYGIQANKEDGSGWIHLAEDGEPMCFDTPGKAGEKIKELERRFG